MSETKTFPSRRALLAGSATVGAAAATIATVTGSKLSPLNAKAGLDYPDAPLFHLVAKYRALQAAADLVDETIDRLSSEYQRLKPERPQALAYKGHLYIDHRSSTETLRDGTTREIYGEKEVADFRANPRMAYMITKDTGGEFVWMVDKDRQRRADEIVAAHDAWCVECEHLAGQLGLHDAHDDAQDLADRSDAVLDELFGTKARTTDGLKIKAEIVRERGEELWGEGMLDGLLDEMIAFQAPDAKAG
ncbi:hypothetical protein [Methyloferula stellata]|uniref:hypothetical protein n=1 Tax=Methyloferula stellata TaxID=876270 RepID=UPI000366B6AD|nr:hypothetical protein [Methyloferula stellata]